MQLQAEARAVLSVSRAPYLYRTWDVCTEGDFLHHLDAVGIGGQTTLSALLLLHHYLKQFLCKG